MAFLITFIMKQDSDVAEYESDLGKTKVDMETISLENQGIVLTSLRYHSKRCMACCFVSKFTLALHGLWQNFYSKNRHISSLR